MDRARAGKVVSVWPLKGFERRPPRDVQTASTEALGESASVSTVSKLCAEIKTWNAPASAVRRTSRAVSAGDLCGRAQSLVSQHGFELVVSGLESRLDACHQLLAHLLVCYQHREHVTHKI